MRSRAIFSGILFVLGTIGLAVMAFMPLMLNVDVQGYGALTVSNFWMPFADLFANLAGFVEAPTQPVIAVFCALLFGLMVIFTVINALRAISKLDRLCMHGNKRVGFNQNKLAVDKLASIFSCSFSLVTVHTFIIMLLNPTEGAMFSSFFVIAVLVYLAIHIITGPIIGSISTFTIRDCVAEKPRAYGGFGPFLRNLLQFAAIGGVFFFALQLKELPINLFPELVDALCNMPKTIESFASGDLEIIFHKSVLLVWGIGLLAFLGFYRHAINFTEFNACGPKAKGKKSARVASFFTFLSLFLLWAHPIILHIVETGIFPEWNSILEYSYGKIELLYATAVMLGMFLIECILANCPKMKRKYRGTTGEVALMYDMPDVDGEMLAKSAMSTVPATKKASKGKDNDPVMVMMTPNGQPVMMVPTPAQQPTQYAQPAPQQPMQYALPMQYAQPAPQQPMQYAQPTQYAQPAPVQPVRPVQPMPAQPAPVQPVARPAQTVQGYSSADIEAIKSKWVQRGLAAARKNQNK